MSFHKSVRGPNEVHLGPTSSDIEGKLQGGSHYDKKSFVQVGLWWCVFVSLHLFCCIYFTTMWWGYWNLPGTSLDVWLYFYNLGLGTDNEHTIALMHGCLALIHAGYLLWMIGWSLKKRRLVLAVYNVFTRPATRARRKGGRLKYYISCIYYTIFSRYGLIGVDGPYFDLVLFCREVVETALQTQQAYRMSLLLPRTQLNRGYVALLVLNCWSTALVHSVFHRSATKRRFYTIVCDCVLDLVTSVGISTVLIYIYSRDFNVARNEFPLYKWYEDIWVVHAISEFQLLLVTTWGDLAMRMVFSLSMLSNMNNMKKFLTAKRELKMVHTNKSRLRNTSILPQKVGQPGGKTIHKRRLQLLLSAESKLTHVLFFVWGTVVLVLHLHAESISGLPQCQMQVKPWFSIRPSCSLLVLDCYRSKLVGAADEITAQWNDFDPKTPACVAIRHCPRLEMPPILTQFSRLKVLKLYNSTITSWNESAAILQTNHPSLIMLFLVRVNMPNGELPVGLQGDELPHSLSDIEFCVTNLRTLPDDFDLKWPQFASIYFEASNLTEVPESLARLAPYDLSLALNPISSIPAKIFDGDIRYLHVGGTRISELPKTVRGVSHTLKLRVDNTNISFFWDWIDPVIANSGTTHSDVPPILAANSPYCSDLQRIYEGTLSNFTAPHYDGQSVRLSNVSVKNLAQLKRTVSCDAKTATAYPLEHEDALSAVVFS
ncbi:unnamed protein product [Phytophthora lilii]|uniref:Unnamed protein product n=1 Tax=Phytophthora lilii TaxID=2077276 RepID=A0A9W6WXB4_9STRA|nr:unnamed protein product [Phytophthora lilii]